MADTVQYRLECMVDELDDLEKRGLFTRQEIAEIVKQRRKFEYRLKRPSPLKLDFLAYIDYETQLDSLRHLRKNAVARELKKNGNKKQKMSVSDFAGVSRIVEIYRLACMRFKGDIELWFRYLDFCRERRNGRMKKVLAQVVRFHPKVPGVWIYAAAWEFDHNLNIASARALMQSGLRVCPNSEVLWIEYLRMELTYLNKLKARRVALGEEKGTLVRVRGDDEKQWKDENKDLFMSIDEGRGDEDGQNVDDEDSAKKLDVFREQGMNILRTVYEGAVETLPYNFGLRKRLLEILEATDLAQSEDMRDTILRDMKRDFSQEPEYWDWLARHEIDDSESIQDGGSDINSKLQKATQVYEEALENVSSPVMFELYLKFLMEVVAPRRVERQLSQVTEHAQNCISHVLRVYEKAEAVGCLTEELACNYVSFYLQLERLDEAQKLAEKLSIGKLADSVKLLLLRGSLGIRNYTKDIKSPNDSALHSIFESLKSVLAKVPISESECLWLMALKFLASERQYFEKLVELALKSVAKERGSENGFSLPPVILNHVFHRDGIQQARQLYRRFLALPHPDLALFRTCIELEQNLVSAGDKDCLADVRKLYESAIATYDQNVYLWRDYYRMEIKLGTAESSSLVYWRARKTLKNFAAHFDAPDLL